MCFPMQTINAQTQAAKNGVSVLKLLVVCEIAISFIIMFVY